MNSHESNYIRTITSLGMLFAVAMVLSFLESLIPFSAILPPGVKPGLSNIITMFSLFYLGPFYGLIIALLKGLFVTVTRGFTAGLLSTCGGLLSIFTMYLSHKFIKSLSNYSVSIIGAVFHNLGQLIAMRFLLGNKTVFAYFPVLLVSGIIMGVVTSIILKAVLPALKRIAPEMKQKLAIKQEKGSSKR